MTEQQTAIMGKEASLLLENPAFAEAMARLRDDVRRQWMDAPVRDAEGQRLLLITAKLVEKIDGTLRGMIEGGKLAQSRIELDSLRDEGSVRRTIRRMTK